MSRLSKGQVIRSSHWNWLLNFTSLSFIGGGGLGVRPEYFHLYTPCCTASEVVEGLSLAVVHSLWEIKNDKLEVYTGVGLCHPRSHLTSGLLQKEATDAFFIPFFYSHATSSLLVNHGGFPCKIFPNLFHFPPFVPL